MPPPTNPESFQLHYPGSIVFGCGQRHQLGAIIDSVVKTEVRALLICTGSMQRNGQLDDLRADCGQRIVACYSGVPAEPDLASVDALRALLRQYNANSVIGAGGGSVLDAGKAAALLATEPGSCADYFHGRTDINGPGLPFFALPTTAGSGAEITLNAVLTDPCQPGVKKSLRSPWMLPAAAVIDPELTLTLPAAQTVSSGFDALTQAIESYLSRRANAVSQALARDATALLLTNLERVWQQPQDLAARSEVAKGSLLSAMAFSQSGLGAVHGLAHPLGALLGIGHGLICAILLPHVLEWNAPVCQAALNTLAQACAISSGSEFIARIKALAQKLQIPADLRDYALSPGTRALIVQNSRSNSMSVTPRPWEDTDIIALLARLCPREK